MQKYDPLTDDGEGWGIELTLSKVSVRRGRNFEGALIEMRNILTELVEGFITIGEMVQIYCVIATDIPVYGTNSTLYEMAEAVWVEGCLGQVSGDS